MKSIGMVNLRARLALLVLITVLPVFGLVLYNAFDEYRTAEGKAWQQAQQIAEMIALTERGNINLGREALEGVMQNPSIRYLKLDECSRYLAQVAQGMPGYVVISAATAQGFMVCNSAPFEPNLDLRDRAYFKRVQKTHAFAIGDFAASMTTQKRVIHIAAPIVNAGGGIESIVLAAYDVDRMNDALARLPLPEGTVVTLFDPDGTILARVPLDPQAVGRNAAARPVFRTILKHNGSGTAELSIRGVNRLFAFAPVYQTPSGSIYLSVSLPRDRAVGAAKRILRNQLLSVGGALALILLMTWVGSSRLVLRRIRALAAHTRRLQEGDLGVRVPVQGDDELGELAESFNAMAAALETREQERRASAEALHESDLQFRLTFERAAVGIAHVAPDGHFILVNQKLCDITGYSREELLGRQFRDITHPEDVADNIALVDRLAEHPQTSYSFRKRYIRKDGAVVWVNVTDSGVPAGDGALKYFIAVIEDIGDRIKAEAEVRLLNQTLEKRVAERTAALEASNRELAAQIAERHRAEAALTAINEDYRRSIQQLEQHQRISALLGRMGNLLQRSISLEEAYRIIADYAQQLFQSDAGGVFTMRASRNLLEAQVTWGGLAGDELAFTPDECWALRSNDTHFYDGTLLNPACGHLHHAARHLCIPLQSQGEAIGLVAIRLRRSPDVAAMPGAVAGDDPSRRGDVLQLAGVIGEQAGLALANLKLRETLHSQSLRDPLTGLYNRRYLEETMPREESRALRNGGEIGMVMLDIDHFKNFNDTYGHDAGDRLIQEVGAHIKRLARAGDIACRYGGEEFTLVLLGASAAQARDRAEQLREAIGQIDLEQLGLGSGHIRISAGVATFPRHGATWQEALKAADQALYEAKKGGRDQVRQA